MSADEELAEAELLAGLNEWGQAVGAIDGMEKLGIIGRNHFTDDEGVEAKGLEAGADALDEEVEGDENDGGNGHEHAADEEPGQEGARLLQPTRPSVFPEVRND